MCGMCQRVCVGGIFHGESWAYKVVTFHNSHLPFLSFSTFHNPVVFPLISLKRSSLKCSNQPWLISCHYLMCWAICYSDTLYSIPGRGTEHDLGALRSWAWRTQTKESWVTNSSWKIPFTHTYCETEDREGPRGAVFISWKMVSSVQLGKSNSHTCISEFQSDLGSRGLLSITFFECFWPLKLSQAR